MSLLRCSWCLASDLYIDYHDNEWGRPIHDDQTLFECMTLESAQAGLSWHTILKKREGYRQAFYQFDIDKVTAIDQEEQQNLLLNPSIVRHKGKIQATIHNAQMIQQVRAEFGSFSEFIWSFSQHKVIDNQPQSVSDVPNTTELAQQMAKALKKRGFKFFGATTCYAFMQAIGMVNDHIQDCFVRHSSSSS